MKLAWPALVSSLCCAAAAAKVGHVFVHDAGTPSTSSQPSSSPVDPETARLIFAQRLGLSRFHSIQHANADMVHQINAHGGRPQQLFGAEDADKSKAHVLVWLDDVDDATDVVSDAAAWSSHFTISSPPPAADNDRLVHDMAAQAEALPKHADAKGRTYSAGIDVEAALSPLKKTTLHNDYLSIFRADKNDDFSRASLSRKLGSLLASRDLSITLVLMPPSSPSSKRTAHPYGTYNLPADFASRRVAAEKILTLDSEPSTSPNPKASHPDDLPVAIAANKGPVHGILPSCFNSLAICQQRTQNCSSHGECKLLHKGRGSDKNTQSSDCYGCACVPTIKNVGEAKGANSQRTVTHWGGPACQKKDISVQFWLFVGVGVILAFLVSSSIGMLYSMGSEELPSVIGAGVSGPVRK